MGKNIEDLRREPDATDDVASVRKKDLTSVRKVGAKDEKVGAKDDKRKKITLDDVEPTTTSGSDESMGMSQNMKEDRNND